MARFNLEMQEMHQEIIESKTDNDKFFKHQKGKEKVDGFLKNIQSFTTLWLSEIINEDTA